MLRAMYTSITGLRNHQTMLDTVGNNIANVNTYGFKSSNTSFKDLLRQTMQGAGAPGATLGGTNPIQVGLGMSISAVTQQHTQGALQTTGVNTNLAVQGDGFFRVSDLASLSAGTPDVKYTRDGSFSWDGAVPANLVTSEGYAVIGYANDPVTGSPAVPLTEIPVQFDPTTHADVLIGPDGSVSARNLTTNARDTLAWITMSRFSNPSGLTSIGGNKWSESINSGAPVDDRPNVNGLGTLSVGYLEMSNVDLATEFTEMIKAQRGFQANSRVITTSDEILQELVNLKR